MRYPRRRPAGPITLAWLLSCTTRNGECLEWTRGTKHGGYASMPLDKEHRSVARLVVALANDIDLGQWMALHSCDNPPCINPAHLRPGTPKENATDATLRGRTHSKLRPDDVRDIRRAVSARTCSYSQLAAYYDTTIGNIHAIVHGRSWAHI